MASHQVFTSIYPSKLARLINGANRRVLIATPGIRKKVVQAILDAHDRLGQGSITVIVDCDEEVFRLGYGDFEAITQLRIAGCEVRQCAGLRIGAFICDDRAWVFGPTALYIQSEVHSYETPNAIELSEFDVERIVWRLSPAERVQANFAELPVELSEENQAAQTEIGQSEVSSEEMVRVDKSLEIAPPVPFDVARQVRVFEPYIQYVEISLTGCAIQRRRIVIPKEIQQVGASEEVENRLRTTFELIEKTSTVSSKSLEVALRRIRDNFTKSLGQPWGRVILKAKRPNFDKKIDEFLEQLKEHAKTVKSKLERLLKDSRKKVVEYYLPPVMKSPPDALLGQIIDQNPSKEVAEKWLNGLLQHAFPDAEKLMTNMHLDVQFRDVTYETLNNDDFALAIRNAYQNVDWDKPFNDFKAAKERDNQISLFPD